MRPRSAPVEFPHGFVRNLLDEFLGVLVNRTEVVIRITDRRPLLEAGIHHAGGKALSRDRGVVVIVTHLQLDAVHCVLLYCRKPRRSASRS